MLSWNGKRDGSSLQWNAVIARGCIDTNLNFAFQTDQGVYKKKVGDMITDSDMRLVVNINDLRKKNGERAKS